MANVLAKNSTGLSCDCGWLYHSEQDILTVRLELLIRGYAGEQASSQLQEINSPDK